MRRAAAGLALALAGLLASPPVARAADPPPPPQADASKQVVRVFEIRYRDVSDVSVLIEPHLSPTALLAVNKRTKTVKVIDSPEVVQAISDFIAQFDVPPHAVVVRLVLEKAERASAAGGADTFHDAAAWTYVPLAETTLEVLERAEARQSFGPDGAYEIHLALGSVDEDRQLLHFDRFAVTRVDRAATAAGDPPHVRTLMSTPLELTDGVGKVVMTATSGTADVALVVRVRGLVRDGAPSGGN